MPLPWKKAKVSRISRIVADLQPPKPNSLVVETGFPTSLVDLFVKNRDRFKKPIKKKKKQQQQQQQQRQQQHNQPREVEELVISDTIPLANTRELSVEPVNINKKRQSPENLEGQGKNVNRCEVLVGEDRNLDYNQGVKECGDVDDANLGSNGKDKRFLFLVLKMFVVVILALSTTRLAIGITMSTSLLIFLEYYGKHLLCLLKTCLLVLLLLNRRVVSLFRLKKDLWVSKKASINAEKDGSASDYCDLAENLEPNPPVKEIHVVEPTPNMVGRDEANGRIENPTIYDLLNYDKSWDNVDEALEAKNDERGALICGKERSQSCKIRRKFIKKLVPKKLLSVKKGKKGKKEADFSSEVSSCSWREDKLCRGEDTGEQSDLDRQDLSCKGKLTLLQLMEEEKEKERFRTGGKEEFEHTSSISSQALQTKPEMIVVEERVDTERGGSSGYLVLFLIVLAGLVGGRMLALVITVGSCSMLKLVWRRRKYEK
ncbi:hypothetical protein P3X46_022891 [Hevea brasiliensis]|uniref:Uncharacterized protein n=1 Tax=Hevea brasiliensis TaxID=3981 RepID=A0ABQ9L980_HEVBR|nr:hypothetical protein P3X46_022891 [Hevea brasiliensis]